jgi:hypothetical protein
MATTKQVKDMADRLISTLDSLMPSEKADAIVRDVAEELYTSLLCIPGHVVVDESKPMGHMHVGGGKGRKKQMLPIAKYKFEPEA